MPYKNPEDRKRNYKREYQLQVEGGAIPNKLERQRARRAVDKNGTDANGNGKADAREGKDVSHKKPLSKGGSNKDGYFIEGRAKNRARNYKK